MTPPHSPPAQCDCVKLERDGEPSWPFGEHIGGRWRIRHPPNLLMVHYADLKADLPAEMCRIAKFLDITVDELCLADGRRALQFLMHEATRLGHRCRPPMPFLDNGATTFINQGTNGR